MSETTLLQDVDKAVRDTISMCMQLRAEAKALDDQATEKKEMANALLKDIMPKYNLDAVSDEMGNTLRYKMTTRTTINDEALRVAMLEAGVQAETIDTIIGKASKASTSVSVEYRAAKV
jgi:FKBP-type peptidyl-prolyl cis-trans isomerase